MRPLLATVVISFLSCKKGPSDWEKTKEWVRSEFPQVEHVSVEELNERLGSGGDLPVVLDVRTPAEYAVSHLPGAVRVDPEGELPDFVRALDRKRPVIAYCSVGYRSSRLVERLARDGFTDARNLEGSIFEWANKGFPLEREGAPVKNVHPYDEEWGRLLEPSLHAYEPRP
jgi:rhodanese-related sulfurtransferase